VTHELVSREISAGTVSPDGGFYWDGTQWIAALSPDGSWTWNGNEWVRTQSLSGPGSFRAYIPCRDLGLAASILLAIACTVDIVEALFLNDVVTFDGWVNGVRINYTTGFSGLLVFTATAAVFLGWFHRSYRNLAALGAKDLQFSPARAVSHWFIPVASLWKPYRTMQEIWKAGDPIAARSSKLIQLWWAAWLVSLALFNVAAFSGVDSGIVSWQGALSAQSTALAAVLAILVVRSVSARQDERWLHLTAGDGTQPLSRAVESSNQDVAP
jgi:hypothetical protein